MMQLSHHADTTQELQPDAMVSTIIVDFVIKLIIHNIDTSKP
jgi:hypothetical protein